MDDDKENLGSGAAGKSPSRPPLGSRKSTRTVLIEQRVREFELVHNMLQSAMETEDADDQQEVIEQGMSSTMTKLRTDLAKIRQFEKEHGRVPTTDELEDANPATEESIAEVESSLAAPITDTKIRELEEELAASRTQEETLRVQLEEATSRMESATGEHEKTLLGVQSSSSDKVTALEQELEQHRASSARAAELESELAESRSQYEILQAQLKRC